MRGKSVLLLVIALVCGAIASVGLTQMVSKAPVEAPKVPMQKVLVALDDIDINEELTADNIRLEEWPKDRVPEGAIIKLANAEGKFAMHRLFKGEPLLGRKLSDKRIGTEEKIPEGYRAVAVRTSATSAVSNLLLPGSRVDVICYLRQGEGIPQTQTRTILKDVRVFSVNAHTTRDTEGKGKAAIDAKTVTLLVEPSQVQLLMLASQMGTIQFAMRKPDDITDTTTDPTTTRQLLGESEEAGGRPAEQDNISSTGSNSLLEFLDKAPQPTTVPVSAFSPTDEMVVMTPHGPPRKYQWNGVDPFPVEVSLGGAVSSDTSAGLASGMASALGMGGNSPPAAAQNPKNSSGREGNAEGEDRGE